MLTNALKHGGRGADGASDIVVVRDWGERDLRIAVTNPVTPDSSAGAEDGLGLVGMARRLESVGGRLSADAAPAGAAASTFTATAWVPLRDPGAER
jgi:signal transduction histidine kinase